MSRLSAGKDGPYVSQGEVLHLTNLGQLELLRGLTARGAAMRTTVRGFSMVPFIRDGDVVIIAPMRGRRPRLGDVLAFVRPDTGRLAVHRAVAIAARGLMTRGDNSVKADGTVPLDRILGQVIAVEREGRRVLMGLGPSGVWIARLSRIGAWTRLRWLAALPRRAAGAGVQILQSFPIYRSVGRRFRTRIRITEPDERDLAAVHRHVNPSSLDRPMSPRPNVSNWTAKRGSKIVGFVQYVHQAEPGPWAGHWLFSLEIWKAYRGLGIGEILTRRVIETAGRKGARDLRLAVHEDNASAIQLYRKLGFEPFTCPGLAKAFEEEKRSSGRTRITMRKTIAPAPKTIEIQDFGLWEKIKDKRVPLSFDLEVTARCNNNCRHCYINLPAGDVAAKAAELSVDEILSIARQAVDMGAVWCLITGGEPLLREDFAEIYLGLKRLGLLVSVFTNATLIRDEHIALFKTYPPRDIEVTVYGVTRETYETVVRRTGAFDDFTAGVNRLLDSGVRVRLKAMAIRSNLHEQAAIAAFCRDRTKDFFRFDPQLHLRFDGNPVRNDEIRVERLTPEQVVALEKTDGKRFEAMKNNCGTLINESFTHFGCDHLFHCGAGNGSFNVGPDGAFRLCSSLQAEGTTYDLRKGTLAEAWNDFVPKVRDLRSRRKEFLESCRKCPLMNLCLWCPAHAHLETGALDGSTPYFCEVAHARAAAIKT